MKQQKKTTSSHKSKSKNKKNKQKPEEKYYKSLRPKQMKDFIGQKKAKNKLEVFIQAAQKRKEPLDHLLLYGPPGLGKTTLAHVIASELGVSIRVTSGPAIERSGDLASILTNLKKGDILFIDEVHRLKKIIEESLYPAMEDFALDIILGKGPSARTVRLDLPKFTIVAATTKAGLLSSPLRDRFGAIYRLNFYKQKQLAEIIRRSAKILKIPIEDKAALILAKRARGTPRVANRLLKRIRDFAQIKGEGEINQNLLVDSLKVLEIDKVGLSKIDRELLRAICVDYQGGPVGLDTLAATISEDVRTLEEFIEPFLIQKRLLKRTKSGRKATKKAFDHLGIAIGKDIQDKLF